MSKQNKSFCQEFYVGQNVFWKDPDASECSQQGTIVEIKGDFCCIETESGGYLEAYCWELEPVEWHQTELCDVPEEAGDYEFYCMNCAGIVPIDAEECPTCHTKDF